MSERRECDAISYPPRFVRTAADRQALVVLLHLASLTPRHLGNLAMTHRSARACLEAVRRAEAGSDADVARSRSMDPADALARVVGCGARLVAVGDAEYPPESLDLFDPPAALFVRGRDLAGMAPRVSIVGARNCSPTGRDAAKQIAGGVARAGACVVSGAARGIDAAAHTGALVAGGPTIAVLGCGIDIVYPRENRLLLDQILRTGAVVSEYPPGTPAEPFRFPARNRIVAALSRAVVVVEGALGSGSMITAEHALDIGREVFAVPGAVNSALAAVPLRLMREGARMVRDDRDLLEDLRWEQVPPDGPVPAGEAGDAGPGIDLSANEADVWRALGAPLTPDQVGTLIALPLPAVLSALARLEIRGLVREVGGRYERRALAVRS